MITDHDHYLNYMSKHVLNEYKGTQQVLLDLQELFSISVYTNCIVEGEEKKLKVFEELIQQLVATQELVPIQIQKRRLEVEEAKLSIMQQARAV